MGAAIGVAAIGTQVYGAISSASSKADAARQDAALKNQQADELLSREQINEQLILDQSELAQKSYGSAFASTGREGAGIGGILQIQKSTAQSIANDRRDADFKAKMLRAGANIATNLASDTETAGYITGAGTILAGAGKIASLNMPPSSKTVEIPKVDE